MTGGAGFFGGILRDRLLADGCDVVSVDLLPDHASREGLRTVQGDIRDRVMIEKLFADNNFDVVYHCAAMLAHAVKDKRQLWTSNVDGTRVLAEVARDHGVGKFVFISSNCLWGKNFGRPVVEDDVPEPVELYGLSKWEGEKALLALRDDLDSVIIRTPTIMDSGRLGLLAILYSFIEEGRKVWMVGPGTNRYQFVHAADLADACVKGAAATGSHLFNVGSDDVKPLREVYQHVIDRAGTGSRVASLPKAPTIAAMRLAHLLRISPLGPYHYKMIAEDFIFDTSKIKRELGWQAGLRNEDMLLEAYTSYVEGRQLDRDVSTLSAHQQPAKMGAIRLLKALS